MAEAGAGDRQLGAKKIRVLELYSGIGGMHYALKESGVPFEVVAAVDVNDSANAVYRHNFPTTKLMQRCIESLTVAELDNLAIDLVHMSPPCQPFTRMGKQRDDMDERTKSFFSFLHLLPKLAKLPSYIFVENVKGFDVSATRDKLLTTLRHCHYGIQEFLLTPMQFGIPNSRLRYYLLAKQHPFLFDFPVQSQIWHEIPHCADKYLVHRRHGSCHERRGWRTVNTQHCSPEHHCTATSCQQPCPGTSAGARTTSHLVSATANVHACDEPTPVCAESESTGVEPKSARVEPTPERVEPTPERVESTSEHVESAAARVEPTSPHVEPTSPHVEPRSERVEPLSPICTPVRPSSSSAASSGDQSDDALESDQSETPAYERYASQCSPIADYLELDADMTAYMVPERFFRRLWVMDIITADARHSCCFTKRYGHHIEGAGSIIQMQPVCTVDMTAYKSHNSYDEAAREAVRAMRLRHFTPREIANLMCFPQDFEFPAGLQPIQCYRLLGNSLNVHVISVLLRLLIGSR